MKSLTLLWILTVFFTLSAAGKYEPVVLYLTLPPTYVFSRVCLSVHMGRGLTDLFTGDLLPSDLLGSGRLTFD